MVSEQEDMEKMKALYARGQEGDWRAAAEWLTLNNPALYGKDGEPKTLFDLETETENVIDWVKGYFAKQPHAKGAVLGISGGKDSALCAAIICNAIGPDRLLGVSMPNFTQKDKADAKLLAKKFKFELIEVDIGKAHQELMQDIRINGSQYELSKLAEINMLPRLRMTALYALSANKHYRVCGTGNLSEDHVGYATKWGDLACDFDPIQYFTTDEIVAMGDYLGVPFEISHKAPSDGICGLTDEDQMGICYKDINTVLRGNASDVDPAVYEKIQKMHEYNLHKVKPIPCYRPEWVLPL